MRCDACEAGQHSWDKSVRYCDCPCGCPAPLPFQLEATTLAEAEQEMIDGKRGVPER